MIHDLLIVGGGINGAAIAREAAINGLSVLLVERGDLASATSSASTKLIHGGLRYLEYGKFRLVREALQERERLLAAAPHVIRPVRFVIPHAHAVRPRWMIRAGLFLYDWLGGKSRLPRSHSLQLLDRCLQAPLKRPAKGFVYNDCVADDSRLTLLNAMDAAHHGAEIRTRTELISARREGSIWLAALSRGEEARARVLVNAAGPWVAETLSRSAADSTAHIRWVKGSHIIVPRRYEGEQAYLLQQPDRRVVFAIPYEDHFTLIGTTDLAVDAPSATPACAEEIDYLCTATNLYFSRSISAADVVHSYSGVRPLYDDGVEDSKAVTRDYVLEMDENEPPLLSIFGGKITTARRLAEEALALIADTCAWPHYRNSKALVFPGGAIADFEEFLAQVRIFWPFLNNSQSLRMARAYGTMLHEMLHDVREEVHMGHRFGAGFTEVEARWMHDQEWARTAEDCLWRRSKLGLHMTAVEQTIFARWWRENFEP
ncbi:glycerol-3-phosphate dehydrogenase [Rhizorhapis sp. SPR117]|uniref:glycerol-3-phosphate dehydrogenase n=1 Tax=Rhizorhapis sp. SPR117 TaxID=2912611 RepID=UPI001F00937B|nr:glycerol-3-phosphate dehydrogenase [Rhizorhapis sp. SPR117]